MGRWSGIDKQQGVLQVGVDHLVPEQMTDGRNDRWSRKGKRLSDLSNQEAKPLRFSWAKPLPDGSGDGWVVVDRGSIAIQGQQVRFLCRLRKRLFGMDHIAPASLLADGSRRFLALLKAEPIQAFGEGHLMNFYLAGRPPDDEIRHVRMRGSLSVRKSQAFGLASVLLDGRVAVEQQGQLAFLKGFALDGFMGFAGDGVAEVFPNRGDTPDIPWWRFTFESHVAPPFLLDDAAEVREERNDDFCVHAYVGGFETSLGTFSTLAVKHLGFPRLRWNLHGTV